MGVYITLLKDNKIKIKTIENKKLINLTEMNNNINNINNIFLDKYGRIYIYKNQYITCLETNKSIKIISLFQFEEDYIFYYDINNKLKKLNLETFDSLEYKTIFPIKINNIKSINKTIIYYNENSLVLNNKLKEFLFQIKFIKISKDYFLILDYENKIHLFNPIIMEIDLIINSFKDIIIEIHSNPFISYAGISTKEFLTILDLKNKKIKKKLNISMESYNIYFINDDKLIINGNKLILYNFKTDEFINLIEEKCKIFYFNNEINFNKILKEDINFSSDIENLRTLIIEMKLQFSKEVFNLKEKLEKLEDKLNNLKD